LVIIHIADFQVFSFPVFRENTKSYFTNKTINIISVNTTMLLHKIFALINCYMFRPLTIIIGHEYIKRQPTGVKDI
jgi:hypothetical protein